MIDWREFVCDKIGHKRPDVAMFFRDEKNYEPHPSIDFEAKYKDEDIYLDGGRRSRKLIRCRRCGAELAVVEARLVRVNSQEEK